MLKSEAVSICYKPLKKPKRPKFKTNIQYSRKTVRDMLRRRDMAKGISTRVKGRGLQERSHSAPPTILPTLINVHLKKQRKHLLCPP